MDFILRRTLPLILGYIIDLILGDPVYSFHPIRLIGWLIYYGERVMNRAKDHKYARFLLGAALSITVIGLAFALSYLILYLLALVHPLLAFIVETLFCWQILAVTALKKESVGVGEALEEGNLEKARTALSMIVGRDTAMLNEKQIIKAAVETVAENTADGVIAPMFYMALGGAPLGFLYKAVNTLDSMIGYKNERYFYFGKFAAKLDDVLNYIPARISALLMLLSGALTGFNPGNGWFIYRRDRMRHNSPNSAHTEAMCAGLMDIQLGGPSYYQGVLVDKPTIGDANREIVPADIRGCNKIMMATAFIGVVLFSLLKLLFYYTLM